jgi:RNA polymerase sigma-70 factor (sigma-E family)
VRFEEFATSRLSAALRFAGVLTGDRALAEDVVQEVLIRVSKRWEQIGQLDRPELYVRKMIVNEYLSWRRRSWRLLPNGTATDVDDRVTPDHAALHAERDSLLAELAKLPRRQRAVLVLRYYEGLSDAEIAELLGCTPGTVRGYASRALAALRVELSPRTLLPLGGTTPRQPPGAGQAPPRTVGTEEERQ